MTEAVGERTAQRRVGANQKVVQKQRAHCRKQASYDQTPLSTGGRDECSRRIAERSEHAQPGRHHEYRCCVEVARSIQHTQQWARHRRQAQTRGHDEQDHVAPVNVGNVESRLSIAPALSVHADSGCA